MQLVIGNKNYSSWSLRPWLLLRHFQVEFTEVQESLRQEGLRERFLRYSPSGRVPVLIDNGLTVWDSLAICEYVSEVYLHGTGWPDDPWQRALARSLAAEMHSGFVPLRNELPMNLRAHRRVQLSEAARVSLRRVEEIWSDCLRRPGNTGPWLFGRFSIADCMFAPMALRFPTYGVTLEPAAQAYVDRIQAEPNVKDWIAAALQESEIIPEDEAGDPV